MLGIIRSLAMAGRAGLPIALIVTLAQPSGGEAAAGEAQGTLTHKARTVTFTHAYLVTGPDGFEPKKTVRRVILSTKDVGAKLRGCETMSCADGVLLEGLAVDLDGGLRLNYWMTVNDQLVQYSGTKPPAALETRADQPRRLAGRLAFDDTPSGGPKVEVEFDAALVKEYKAAR
jgi:hypothetical protein